jgi:hypothetical protein
VTGLHEEEQDVIDANRLLDRLMKSGMAVIAGLARMCRV